MKKKNPKDQLWRAIYNHDATKVKAIIQENKINCNSAAVRSAFVDACHIGNVEITAYIMKLPGKLTAKNIQEGFLDAVNFDRIPIQDLLFPYINAPGYELSTKQILRLIEGMIMRGDLDRLSLFLKRTSDSLDHPAIYREIKNHLLNSKGWAPSQERNELFKHLLPYCEQPLDDGVRMIVLNDPDFTGLSFEQITRFIGDKVNNQSFFREIDSPLTSALHKHNQFTSPSVGN